MTQIMILIMAFFVGFAASAQTTTTVTKKTTKKRNPAAAEQTVTTTTTTTTSKESNKIPPSRLTSSPAAPSNLSKTSMPFSNMPRMTTTPKALMSIDAFALTKGNFNLTGQYFYSAHFAPTVIFNTESVEVTRRKNFPEGEKTTVTTTYFGGGVTGYLLDVAETKNLFATLGLGFGQDKDSKKTENLSGLIGRLGGQVRPINTNRQIYFEAGVQGSTLLGGTMIGQAFVNAGFSM